MKITVAKRTCVLFVFCAAAAIATSAQATANAHPATTFTTLHSFDRTDGGFPQAGLVQATNGKFYGTTFGANGEGTVFSMTAGGALTTLDSFGYTDAYIPYAGLVQGTNGKFYGTTGVGGANSYGTVYSITAGGTLTTLHSFDYTDGSIPVAALVQGADGNFYGTAVNGGNSSCNRPYGCGTVFRITPSGELTTLHSFDLTDGDQPYGGLLQGTNGKFYGTTQLGGANGDGTVFRITAGGALTVLHSFDGTDGEDPDAGLVQGADGSIYGTTVYGGANGGGTVFSITAGGTLTTLHSFDGTDGELPGGLVQAINGKFYGTTYQGGDNGGGTIFEVTSNGALTTLYNFCSQANCADGESPEGGLIQDTNGTFYGTTTYGGTSNLCCGTVFNLSVGLGPFVKTNPTSGEVDVRVIILGTNLTGATSVTFNGTAATFTVKSKSEITMTVPTGATTGTVQVVSSGGTLSSNVAFRVLP